MACLRSWPTPPPRGWVASRQTRLVNEDEGLGTCHWNKASHSLFLFRFNFKQFRRLSLHARHCPGCPTPAYHNETKSLMHSLATTNIDNNILGLTTTKGQAIMLIAKQSWWNQLSPGIQSIKITREQQQHSVRYTPNRQPPETSRGSARSRAVPQHNSGLPHLCQVFMDY